MEQPAEEAPMDRVLGSGRAELMGEEMAALVAECLWGKRKVMVEAV